MELGYRCRASQKTDEVILLLKSSAKRGRVDIAREAGVEQRVQGPNQQGGTGREDTFTHIITRIGGVVPCLAHNQETPAHIRYPLFSADTR